MGELMCIYIYMMQFKLMYDFIDTYSCSYLPGAFYPSSQASQAAQVGRWLKRPAQKLSTAQSCCAISQA